MHSGIGDHGGPVQIHAFRLKPGQDLYEQIEAYLFDKRIEAGCMLSAVGSLTRATLRLANRDYHSEFDGPFEIVSITGTVSTHGLHLHVSISDGGGKTLGGHLVAGCTIYTTAELVVAEFDELVFTREMSADSGYEELVVRPR